MKIISIEFVNHIKLGTFKMDWDNSIISIVGANGSGKSFLLSSLHPFGTSNRYHKAYPVLPGKTGYKKISYDVDGIIYETIHEYVPNNSTHKCKSYLNRITNGNKEELNDTGNVENFRKLVYEHLKFNSDIFDIGFISFKANGITGTPTSRRSVLESTVDMKLLNKMKNNTTRISANNNALITMNKKKFNDLTSYGSIETIAEKIANNKASIATLETNIQNIDNNINVFRRAVEALEGLDASSLPSISKTIQILSKTSINAFNELLIAYNDAKSNINRLTFEYESLKRTLVRIEDNRRLIKQKRDTEIELANNEIKIKDAETKLLKILKYLEEPNAYNVMNMMHEFIKINNYLEQLSTPVFNKTYKEIKEEKTAEIEKLKVVVDRFERAMSLSDGKEYTVPYTNNCDGCEIYRKFVKSTDFIKKYKANYEAAKEQIKVLNNDIMVLDNIKFVADNNIWKNNILSFMFNETYLRDNHLTNLDDFLSQIKPNEKWRETIAHIRDTQQEYDLGVSAANNYRSDLNIISSQIVEDTHNEDEINLQLTEIQKEVVKYRALLEHDVENISLEDKYKFKTVSELVQISNDIANSSNKKKDLDQQLQLANRDRVEYTDKITELNRETIVLELKKQELENTSKELDIFMNEREVISRCKEIIDKHIPLLLLENNLKFLEDITNEILIDNNIPIQLQVKIDNNMINIPVTVGDNDVPDASMLSAGETCLVSLILNACILHLLGYNIMCLDEIDANLDVERRKQFNNIVVSIMTKLDIDQICCISHNISSTIDSATIIQIGESQYEVLSTDIIKI